MRARFVRPRSERGVTLVELLAALIVLSLGVLAVAQLFPSGSRAQLQDRMRTTANYYAQEKIEQLTGLTWSDPALTTGRHPAAGNDTLGASGQWQRFYQVTAMTAPLDNLKMVTVTASWTYLGPHSVTATTYMRR